MNIPFIDLSKQYQSIQQEVDHAISQVINQARFVGGSTVSEFENKFATAIGSKNCVGTGNGTDSLFLILKALNIKEGDEVIVPAFGCMPTAEVVTLTKAKVIFAEVHPDFYTLDPASVKNKISKNTKAIIVVHLYGQSAQLNELFAICDHNKIHLIEDCAQSHLTKFNNQCVGTFGVASGFSFYPTKNLGAFGDAGCVLTNNSTLSEKIRRLANHGALEKNDHLFEGCNSRLDTLHAAILSAKLNYLNAWTQRRKEIAARYKNLLGDTIDIALPSLTPNSEHSFHIFCITTPFRDHLKNHLKVNGIQTLVHYPKGLPFTKAYEHLGHKESDFPVTARLQNEVLSLPIYPELTNEEVDYIVHHIKDFFRKNKVV